MKKILIITLTLFVAFNADAYKKPKFKPYVIENLETRPDFWRVRVITYLPLTGALAEDVKEMLFRESPQA